MTLAKLLDVKCATSVTSSRLAKLVCFAFRRSSSNSAETATHLTPSAKREMRRPPSPDQRSRTRTRPLQGIGHGNCGKSDAPRQAKGLQAKSLSAKLSPGKGTSESNWTVRLRLAGGAASGRSAARRTRRAGCGEPAGGEVKGEVQGTNCWTEDAGTKCIGHWSLEDADVAKEEGALEDAAKIAEDVAVDALVLASIRDKLLGPRVAVTVSEAAAVAPGPGVVPVPPARAGGRCP